MTALSLRSPVLLSLGVLLAAPVCRGDSGERVFSEVAPGMILVEAEGFFAQSLSDKRAWYITSAGQTPTGFADIDPPHVEGTGGGAYIEVLPDTGVDGGKLTKSENFSDVPGEMALAHFRVRFASPGRYFIWARGFGFDGDDNTLHFGLDGAWPDSSARMHLFGGKKWLWACRHRQNKGKIFFDIPTAGSHVVAISMREDGCELDRFLLTTDENYVPPEDTAGPDPHGEAAASPFVETAGALVIETESVAPTSGWEFVPETAAGTGRGYLRWSIAGQGRKADPASVLSYTFRITTPGTYQFFLRSRLPDPANRPETPDPDGNDIWVRWVGGADAPGQKELGEGQWNKVAILGHPPGWTWDTHADRGAPHPDSPVCRVYSTPGVYRVELAGRSHGHAIDRLAFIHAAAGARPRLAPADEEKLSATPASARE